jgi:PIN domain nuclease of toxin-antitoxin system
LNLLLDTHIAIWIVTGSNKLSQKAHDLIANNQNKVFISAVTIWEIAIKSAQPKKKDAFPFSSLEAIIYFQEAGFTSLDIKPSHAALVETLPLLHCDPFDRLLIAQALSEPMRLLTADAILAQYSDTVIMVG